MNMIYGNKDYIIEYERRICPKNASRSSRAEGGAKRSCCHQRPQNRYERAVKVLVNEESVNVVKVVVVIVKFYPLRE